VFRPAIVLPAGAERYGAVEARAILAHELAHVRRGDCLTGLLGELSRAVYWFNPLVHLALRRLGEECEAASDDVVLAAGTPPTAYATILLEAVRQASVVRPSAALVSMAQGSGLERRVRRILAAGAGRGFSPRMPALHALSYVAAAALLASVAGAQVGNGPSALPPEPDLAGDLLARPESERLPDAPRGSAASRTLLAGPDSALARMLADAAARPSRHETDLVPERARWALAQANGGRLVEPLIARMASPDWRVRAYAAWALGHAGDPRALPALLTAADDPNWRLRAMAGTALSRLGDLRAFAAMAKALRDPAWQVRVGAVEYMGRWGGAEGRALMRPFLDDRHVAVRSAASSFLATRP
ncbi:MAG TPA: M56 family metallopeptidase, partial [Longimicrobium sp.]